MGSTLLGTDRPLAELYDVALLDLDGVVYIGPVAVPGAPRALSDAREAGMQLAFVTNNAARPPSVVAAHLTELGIPAGPGEVITSSQAAARYLAEHLPAGATVLVLGTTGLYEALSERGLSATETADDSVQAVVQGYSPDMNWRLLAEGAVAINAGALWVATNADPTVPSARGPLPGNGSLVAALRLATRTRPVITGKPDPTMHRETLIRTGAERPIVVGDRLDTDIEGANAVGCPSLLVFSGVTDARDLLSATTDLRPTYLGADVGALLVPHPAVEVTDDSTAATATCRGWRAVATGNEVLLSPAGSDAASDAATHATSEAAQTAAREWDDDMLDAVRALCAARWSGRGGADPDTGSTVSAHDPAADAMLRRLGLATG